MLTTLTLQSSQSSNISVSAEVKSSLWHQGCHQTRNLAWFRIYLSSFWGTQDQIETQVQQQIEESV